MDVSKFEPADNYDDLEGQAYTLAVLVKTNELVLKSIHEKITKLDALLEGDTEAKELVSEIKKLTEQYQSTLG